MPASSSLWLYLPPNKLDGRADDDGRCRRFFAWTLYLLQARAISFCLLNAALCRLNKRYALLGSRGRTGGCGWRMAGVKGGRRATGVYAALRGACQRALLPLRTRRYETIAHCCGLPACLHACLPLFSLQHPAPHLRFTACSAHSPAGVRLYPLWRAGKTTLGAGVGRTAMKGMEGEGGMPYVLWGEILRGL